MAATAAERLEAAKRHAENEEVHDVRREAEEALRLFREAQDGAGIAESLRLFASANVALGRRREADALVQEQLALFRSAGDELGAARMLLATSEANQDGMGQDGLQVALRSASEARALFRKHGEGRLEAAALLELANAHLRSRAEGSEAEALSAVEAAVPLLRSAGDTKGQAVALHSKAVALVRAEDFLSGIEAAKEAATLFKQLGLQRLEATELRCLANWLLQDEQPAEAVVPAREAVELFRELKNKAGEVLAREQLVNALVVSGDSSQALEVASSALADARQAGDKTAEAAALELQVTAYLARVDVQRAAQAAASAVTAYETAGDGSGASRMLNVVSQLDFREDRYDKALESAERAAVRTGAGAEDKALAWQIAAAAQLARENVAGAEKALAELTASLGSNANSRRAGASMTSAGVHASRRDFSKALALAAYAQSLLSELGDARGEASCMHFIARVHMAREEYPEALAAAEGARALVRTTGELAREVGLLVLVVQICTFMLIEGRRGLNSTSKAFLEGRGRDKVLRTAKEAVQLAPQVGDDPLLTASALHALARAQATNGELEAALERTGEAVPLFRQAGDLRGEAATILLNANIHLALKRGDLAIMSCKEALQLFRRADDLVGEVEAMDLLARLSSTGGPALPIAAGVASAVAGADAGEVGEEGGPRKAPADGAAAPVIPKMPTDIMTLPFDERVKASVTALVLEAIGRDDIEEDRTLMETGMTSIASIMLRDRIQNEFPDIEEMDLTFVFDYPTVREISEFIVDALGDQ